MRPPPAHNHEPPVKRVTPIKHKPYGAQYKVLRATQFNNYKFIVWDKSFVIAITMVEWRQKHQYNAYGIFDYITHSKKTPINN